MKTFHLWREKLNYFFAISSFDSRYTNRNFENTTYLRNISAEHYINHTVSKHIIHKKVRNQSIMGPKKAGKKGKSDKNGKSFVVEILCFMIFKSHPHKMTEKQVVHYLLKTRQNYCFQPISLCKCNWQSVKINL